MNVPIIPESASTFANQVDYLLLAITLLTVVFTLAVGIGVLYFSLKYRRGARADRRRPLDHHNLLELGWSLPPLFLGLGIFFWGAILFAQVRQPPANAEEVFVIGKRWMWHAQHSNGVRENNKLHVPIGQPVKLTMVSQDVIHDFFVPAFRLHQDVIPGKFTYMWFTPTRVGEYRFFCSQYCGTNHSEMVGWVTVMEPAEYQKWLARGGDEPDNLPQTLEARGAKLWEQLNCGSCHAAADTVHGPSLVGIYNRPRPLTNGQTVRADNEYLREAIVEPGARIVKGYENTMPAYPVGPAKGQLTEENIFELIAYMRSLGPGGAPQAVRPASGAGETGQTGKGANAMTKGMGNSR